MTIMNANYVRGSEWRRWDLHVHSPYSVLNNGFGSDFDVYAEKLFRAAIEHSISAIGITDYFSIDGYKKIIEWRKHTAKINSLFGEEAAKVQTIKIFPNIEFRDSVIVDSNRVNFHILFSDEVPASDIEDSFLHELKFHYQSEPGEKGEYPTLKSSNLEKLGQRLKLEHEKFKNMSDLFVGNMNAVVEHKQVTEQLENRASLFKDKYLFCIPPDEDLSRVKWDGQGHGVRKAFIQKSHFFFTANENTRNWGLGKTYKIPDEFKSEFRSFKPCIHGSDAHTFEDLFEPEFQRYTWIKADVTFEGLKQVLNEPEDRVYIGVLPPSLQRADDNPTKIMQRLVVTKNSSGQEIKDQWFSTNLPLNPELIAVIGNKGTGKSALADIIGYLGNTLNEGSFSFLNTKKFRDPQNNIASSFDATLHWRSGTADGPENLGRRTQPKLTETVKYIPQNYLETICNETGPADESQFYQELQKVIFSHVPDEDKLGMTSLSDLLKHKSEEAKAAIEALKIELKDVNREIVALENRGRPEHASNLQSALAQKKEELRVHEESVPSVEPKPDVDPATIDHNNSILEKIKTATEEIAKLDEKIIEVRKKLATKLTEVMVADKLMGKIDNFDRQYQIFVRDAQSELNHLGISLDDVIQYHTNKTPIEKAKTVAEGLISDFKSMIAENINGTLTVQRKGLDLAISGYRNELSSSQRKYQAYVEKLKQWEVKKAQMIGSENSQDTIKYYEKIISSLANIPNEMAAVKTQRLSILKAIFTEKEKITVFFSRYHKFAQQYLDSHAIAKKEEISLNFNASIIQEGLPQRLLQMIDGRKAGPIHKGSGNDVIADLIASSDLNSFEGVCNLVRGIVDMSIDTGDLKIIVKDQLLQTYSTEEFYDLIFGLDYLRPAYNLMWRGKPIEKLSPGERGNLLLIFYLLLDKSDIPLIIDQPEENLDNQTVFKTLVPCIKAAKKRRQIMLVTHNPNLAVVCDADQIIHAAIDKDTNGITYTSGSIENPIMNKAILDVLEGTRPAFDIREAKYYSSELAA